MADLPFSEFYQKNGFVFISGQVPLKSDGNLIESKDIHEHTDQAMKNLRRILKKAGLDFSSVVMTNIYLADIDDFSKVNEVYIKHLKKPYPARVTVGVKALPLGARIEISMIASKK